MDCTGSGGTVQLPSMWDRWTSQWHDVRYQWVSEGAQSNMTDHTKVTQCTKHYRTHNIAAPAIQMWVLNFLCHLAPRLNNWHRVNYRFSHV